MREDPEYLDSDVIGAGIPWLGIALTLAGVCVMVLAVVLIEPLNEAFRHVVQGDTKALRHDIRELGGAGVLLIYALILMHTFVWYPAEIINAAAGLVYDFWPALLLVMSGWMIQAQLAYQIGRGAARPLLYRMIGASRFHRAELIILHGGVPLLLAARVIPFIPFSLFCCVCGAAHVPVWRYIWTTFVGYLPITALFVFYGTRLHALSLSDPTIWIGAVALVLMALSAHWIRPRLTRPKQPEANASPPSPPPAQPPSERE